MDMQDINTINEQIKLSQVVQVDGQDVLVLANGAEQHTFTDEKHKPAPRRRTGNLQVADLQSFVELTNRWKHPDSIVATSSKAEKNRVSASMVTVFNPAPAGSDFAKAGHSDDKVSYHFPVSKALADWLAKNELVFDQTEFAVFLEDMLPDIASPSSLKEPFPPIIAGSSYGEPLDLLNLSRRLELTVTENVVSSARLSSGETEMKFSQEHKATAGGQTVRIPDAFLLRLPLFDRGQFYVVPVRLRYRVKDGKPVFSYSIYRLANILENAVADCESVVSKACELPMVRVA